MVDGYRLEPVHSCVVKPLVRHCMISANNMYYEHDDDKTEKCVPIFTTMDVAASKTGWNQG